MERTKYREILEYLRGLISGTKWEGHLYAVGGCCRDDFMCMPINDIDLAVDTPNGGIEFAKWLRRRNLTAGLPILFNKFGTAKLHLKKYPEEEIEIVQTRKEKYTDRTKAAPETAFGSIEEDCERRDLTINTLFYDISRQCGLDLTGQGVHDIENRIIRTPLDPDATFDDDPVRILRAIRFACRFGWEIEEETLHAMQRNVHRLEIVSPQRAQGELSKMLMGPNPRRALEMLRDTGAMKYFIPELTHTYDLRHKGISVWEHQLCTMEKVPDSLPMRLAALLHDLGKTVVPCECNKKGNTIFVGHESRSTGMAARILKRMHYSKNITEEVLFYIANHMRFKDTGENAERLSSQKLARLRRQCRGRQRFQKLLDFIHADNNAYPAPHSLPHQIPAIRNRKN